MVMAEKSLRVRERGPIGMTRYIMISKIAKTNNICPGEVGFWAESDRGDRFLDRKLRVGVVTGVSDILVAVGNRTRDEGGDTGLGECEVGHGPWLSETKRGLQMAGTLCWAKASGKLANPYGNWTNKDCFGFQYGF
ncbi:hypothetical protein EI94DRAFT_1696897 [Lactarius quietus]|nr:hypothetical protein EI94DRAFT_1696897 [Lactarius quietus]